MLILPTQTNTLEPFQMRGTPLAQMLAHGKSGLSTADDQCLNRLYRHDPDPSESTLLIAFYVRSLDGYRMI